MEEITTEQVRNMSIEELGQRLKELGWEQISDTVFANTFNVNDYKGLDDVLIDWDVDALVDTRFITDPCFLTIELDIKDKTEDYYFWNSRVKPKITVKHNFFYQDDFLFMVTVVLILRGDFVTRRKTAFKDIWEVLIEDCAPNVCEFFRVSLVRAKEEWSGFGVNTNMMAEIKVGDYALMTQWKDETVPIHYIFVDKKYGDKLLKKFGKSSISDS